LTGRLEILGFPEVTLEVTADRPRALVAVRLCDVAPDGSSLLVARGLLNLTHRDGHDQVVAVVAGEPMVVAVRLDLSGHAFDAGHRIRLAVSPTYWPFAWPSPHKVTLGVFLGERSRIVLPVRPPDPRDADLAPYPPAQRAAPPAGWVQTRSDRKVSRDLATGRSEVVVQADERSRLDGADLDFGERTTRRHTIYEGEPLSARLDWDAEHFIERGPWRVGIKTRTAMSATAESFLLTTELDAYEGDVRVHASRRSVEIPRDGV
jgi:hypothetical protein